MKRTTASTNAKSVASERGSHSDAGSGSGGSHKGEENGKDEDGGSEDSLKPYDINDCPESHPDFLVSFCEEDAPYDWQMVCETSDAEQKHTVTGDCESNYKCTDPGSSDESGSAVTARCVPSNANEKRKKAGMQETGGEGESNNAVPEAYSISHCPSSHPDFLVSLCGHAPQSWQMTCETNDATDRYVIDGHCNDNYECNDAYISGQSGSASMAWCVPS